TVALLELIQKHCYSLNEEQRLMIFMTLEALISHKDHSNETHETQLVTYVDEEDETEKSQIINAIKIDLLLLNREKEIVLLASTEAAVAQIDDNTIHFALSISTDSRKKRRISVTLRDFWRDKTCMIVNEIDMIT